jgi:tetratricopeptide (TPR) repeat protein
MEEMNDRDNELIFNHINGSLTDADSLLFEQRHQEDAAFRAEVEAYKDAALAAFLGGQSTIKNILRDEAAQYQAEIAEKKQPKVKIVALNQWILRGIAATLLIGVSWWAIRYFETPKVDAQRVFAQNFTPLSELPITFYRSDNVVKIDTLFRQRHDSLTLKQAVKALDLYARKDYTASIEAFNQITATDDTLTLCKATALLATDKPQAAEELLKTLAQNGKGYPQPFAEWYLAMVYLQQGNRAECRVWLDKIIATPNHPYRTNAQELSKKVF